MKLIRLLPCVAAATLLLPAGVAAAQVPDTQVVDVKAEKACSTVTFTLTNPDSGEYGFTYTTGPFAGGPAGERGLIVVPSKKTVSQTIRLGEDSFDGQGFVTLGVAYGPNTDRQKFLDLGLVKTDCAPPVVATTTPAPTTTPATTTAPSTTPSAPAGAVDCADVPQARAQEILDADRSDPNKLDGDRDGTACELDEATPTPVVIDNAKFGQVGEVPVGSVDTGRA